jgi:hypothetical protein
MLGSVLEVAATAPDIRASCEFYARLGFGSAVTGDVWPHHYGVMTCRGLCLGLHGLRRPSPWLVFTRENVARLAGDLESRGFSLGAARLGSDQFNELQLRDPSGLVLQVLEARSFSPPAIVPPVTALGGFDTLSLPLRDFAAGAAFWQRLGADVSSADEPWKQLRIALPGFTLAFHAPGLHDEPLLVFHQQSLDVAGPLLAELGMAVAPGLGGFGTPDHLLARSPEGLALALLA